MKFTTKHSSRYYSYLGYYLLCRDIKLLLVSIIIVKQLGNYSTAGIHISKVAKLIIAIRSKELTTMAPLAVPTVVGRGRSQHCRGTVGGSVQLFGAS